MKKKGLIVATIVMVLVLAVSLTTATYAWFTANASASIDQITITSVAGNGLLIGAKGVASPSDYTGYKTGTIVWDSTNGYWGGTDAQVGLGQTINMYVTGTTDPVPMSIGSEKAVSYTTTAITAETGGDDISANSWYKANGNGATLDKTTLAAANKQADYADLELGVTAAKDDQVLQAWLTIAVTLPSTQSKIGMAAAIHFIVLVDGNPVVGSLYASGEHAGEVKTTEGDSTFEGLSAYPGKVHSNNYASAVTSGTFMSSAGNTKTFDQNHDIPQNGWTYVVPIYDSSTAMASLTTIKTVRIIAWLEGTDDACVVPNAGTGGDINFYFDYATTQQYAWSNGVMSNRT